MNTLTDLKTYDAATFAATALSSAAHLAATLDHTLLKPEATRNQVLQLCAEAAEHRFACAMVNPFWVSTAVAALAGTGVSVGVVIGFPLGASLSASKRDETVRVLKQGAHDVDVVLNVGLLKSGTAEDFEHVQQDIRGVVELAHGSGAIVKVILETCLLSFEEKHRASELCLAAGADFLKTSTGFSTGGATVDDIALLRTHAGTRAGVKASGGIRSLADAKAMLEAGANRIGASASVRILSELAGIVPTSSAPSGY
ncbi:deoxyribose-phosphate aldolase [Granulicella pectinivorans]|uniref:Deoxyribose-phosphate aldolase n=1 Tax=Granulicella pectinivorans TaxID=474950 RepID=A0A1I6MLI2_9BACT|nr:deoxyribose-phosphate aldolase [Granulicella pectinivorans]SFS16553.1 deoxyribose-phosphate aldolase [Granulicella pectinivorans]